MVCATSSIWGRRLDKQKKEIVSILKENITFSKWAHHSPKIYMRSATKNNTQNAIEYYGRCAWWMVDGDAAVFITMGSVMGGKPNGTWREGAPIVAGFSFAASPLFVCLAAFRLKL